MSTHFERDEALDRPRRSYAAARARLCERHSTASEAAESDRSGQRRIDRLSQQGKSSTGESALGLVRSATDRFLTPRREVHAGDGASHGTSS